MFEHPFRELLYRLRLRKRPPARWNLSVGSAVILLWQWHPDFFFYVHPDDRVDMTAKSEMLTQRVYEVVGLDRDYVVIRVQDKNIRLIPNTETVRPHPHELRIGETVGVVDRDYVGEIVDISWHFKRDEVLFTLQVDGKQKSRYYFLDDLKAVKQ